MLRHTRTIPIVFAVVSDPIGGGFVASFPRPGGNVTGFTNIEPTMATKWLEMLKEVAPRVARVAFLFNPATAPYAEYYLSPFKAAAASVAVEAIPAPVRNTSDRHRVNPAAHRPLARASPRTEGRPSRLDLDQAAKLIGRLTEQRNMLAKAPGGT